MEGRTLRVARLEWLRQMSVAVVASHYRAKGSGRARRVLSATGAIRDPGRVMVEMM